MRTPHLLLLPAALAMLALSACGGGTPGPAPSSTFAPESTETPTASPTPEPDQSTIPARIQVGVNSVEIFAADGSTLDEFTMYENATNVVADLTTLFGFAPTETTHPGGLESAPSRTYDWSGFSLMNGEGTEITNADFVIIVSTAAVDGIEIFTIHDLQVGDPMADAVAISDYDGGFPGYTGIGFTPIDPTSVGESADWDLGIFIGVSGSSGGAITSFAAPSPNWGV